MLNREEVEARLIEAVELWRRTPASGFGPARGSGFATDAPWHLLTRYVRADINEEGLKRAEVDELLARAAEGTPPPRSSGLDHAEVARRDEASEWLRFVPERDRRLLVLALVEQERTGRRVDWMRMKGKVGVELGANGLRMRYRRAIGAIVKALAGRCVTKAA